MRWNKMLIAIALITTLILILSLGCSWTAYNRTTYDPNGMVLEQVGVGRIDCATDVEAGIMEFSSPDGRKATIGGYEKTEDSFKLRYNPITKTIELVTGE